MSTITNKLKLFKYDPVADANNTFNITNALNNNLDNIESKTGLFIYDNTATYSLGDWVLGVVDSEKKIFESLVNSNTGNALTDTTKWKEHDFGLSNKADKDLTNINNTGKIAIAHNAMPSDTYETLTVGASGTPYTAPADGWFSARGIWSANNSFMHFDSQYYMNSYAQTGQNGHSYGYCTLEVRKGQQVIFYYQSATIDWLTFVYAVGSESEAQ